MITQDDIELKVLEFVKDNISAPKFVLLDSNSYDEFVNGLKPIEKIKMKDKEPEVKAQISAMHVSEFVLKILKVESKERLFEVVGWDLTDLKAAKKQIIASAAPALLGKKRSISSAGNVPMREKK